MEFIVIGELPLFLVVVSNLMQMYGKFEGFPFSAVLIIIHNSDLWNKL